MLNDAFTANVPAAAAYQANNICSHSKRSVGSALLVGWGAVGGIVASLIYRQADYPACQYLQNLYVQKHLTSLETDVPGISGTIAFQVLIFTLLGGLSLHFKRMNRRADEEGLVLEGQTGFRYTI